MLTKIQQFGWLVVVVRGEHTTTNHMILGVRQYKPLSGSFSLCSTQCFPTLYRIELIQAKIALKFFFFIRVDWRGRQLKHLVCNCHISQCHFHLHKSRKCFSPDLLLSFRFLFCFARTIAVIGFNLYQIY